MDAITDEHIAQGTLPDEPDYVAELELLRDECAWTGGHWQFGPYSQRRWNELQNTHKDIKLAHRPRLSPASASIGNSPEPRAKLRASPLVRSASSTGSANGGTRCWKRVAFALQVLNGERIRGFVLAVPKEMAEPWPIPITYSARNTIFLSFALCFDIFIGVNALDYTPTVARSTSRRFRPWRVPGGNLA